MSEIAPSTLGHVVWHSSDEDSGPDVGISLGLGGGLTLYVGEISSTLHADGGYEVAALGDDGGWWLVLWGDGQTGGEPLAKFVDAESAREFVERVAVLGRAAAQLAAQEG